MIASFNWLDYTVLSAYILFVLLIATLFVKEQHTLTDFFMASRKMNGLSRLLNLNSNSSRVISFDISHVDDEHRRQAANIAQRRLWLRFRFHAVTHLETGRGRNTAMLNTGLCPRGNTGGEQARPPRALNLHTPTQSRGDSVAQFPSSNNLKPRTSFA